MWNIIENKKFYYWKVPKLPHLYRHWLLSFFNSCYCYCYCYYDYCYFHTFAWNIEAWVKWAQTGRKMRLPGNFELLLLLLVSNVVCVNFFILTWVINLSRGLGASGVWGGLRWLVCGTWDVDITGVTADVYVLTMLKYYVQSGSIPSYSAVNPAISTYLHCITIIFILFYLTVVYRYCLSN